MTNEKPLISVIMPTYNHASFISEAIESVLRQSYQRFEIIIINNYSEDDTVDIVKRRDDDRIRLMDFRNNGIIAASRNRGLREARGDFVAFLDSDDAWHPQKLQRQIEVFKRYPLLLMVATNAKEFPRGKRRSIYMVKDKVISFNKLLCQNLIVNSSVMIKREVIDHVGFLDEDASLCTVEDYDYWLRILKYRDKSALLMNKVLMSYRVHQDNTCGTRIVQNDFTPLVNVRKKVSLILEKYKEYNEPLYMQAKANNERVEMFYTKINAYFEGNCRAGEILFHDKISLRHKVKFLLILAKSFV
jgi:glycosyltransferase involved in cell wall biosynthesis